MMTARDPIIATAYEQIVADHMAIADPKGLALLLAERIRRETTDRYIEHKDIPAAHLAYALATIAMCLIASLKCAKEISPELADALAADFYDTIVRRSIPGTSNITGAVRQS